MVRSLLDKSLNFQECETGTVKVIILDLSTFNKISPITTKTNTKKNPSVNSVEMSLHKQHVLKSGRLAY